jgi:hypothetical protein
MIDPSNIRGIIREIYSHALLETISVGIYDNLLKLERNHKTDRVKCQYLQFKQVGDMLCRMGRLGRFYHLDWHGTYSQCIQKCLEQIDYL